MSGYTPNKWVDREGTTRYFETVDDDGALIFTPDYTQVTEMGTPVNEDNMNHIEEGIAAVSFSKYDSMKTYAKDDLVTAIVDNELKVYKSLQDNNNGNPLTDTNYWEEVEIVGGGGCAGLQMFDTILKDHVLTYEETKGLALQGTYVYKEAVAGSRYGYPDFYAKCLEERNTATATQVTLSGSTITMYIASNGHQYYDIANKDVVDNFFGTMGSAWFYGVDTENERIFLPRNNWFDQTTGDVSEVGQSVEAGLPNITATFAGGNAYWSGQGGAYENKGSTGWGGAGTGEVINIYGTFDASRSSSIYGNSDTVQPPAVKKLLYICVGNTETVSTITDVVEVTTTENDTIPLFTGLFFDFTPNNVSWLKAGQQVNRGGIYTTAYNELVNILNGETKYGDLKVINEADMESGVDYSEYWVVNQDAMSFRTPTKLSYSPINADILTVNGDGVNALQLTNGTTQYSLISGCNSGGGRYYLGNGSANMLLGQAGSTTAPQDTGSNVVSEGTSGLITDLSQSVSNTAQLYFKVANAVQNLELLNAGEVLESLAKKVDINSNVVDGQWIQKYLSIMQNVKAIGSYTYDLSNYLPNDGYSYEVMFNAYINSAQDTRITFGTKPSPTDNFTNCFPAVLQTLDLSKCDNNNFILPIDTSRKVYMQISTTAVKTLSYFEATGYRRIGTNI